MGSTRRQRMRRKFDHNKNRKKAWKNSLKKPRIGCEPMRAAWDERKSLRTNLKEMGISYDPNKSIAYKRHSKQDAEEDVQIECEKPTVTKPQVLQALETDAYTPRWKSVWTTPEVAHFCMTMMDRHGDDYAAMARDPLNLFQHTPKQIRRKMENMKKVPGLYEDYLASRAVDSWNSLSCKMVIRKKTRRYEAARRNGHFTPTHEEDERPIISPASVSKVRRRLNFGRKPPKNRDTHTGPPDSSMQTSSTPQTKPTHDQKESPNQPTMNVEANDTSQKMDTTAAVVPAGQAKPPRIRLKRELKFLLKDADHVVYPVRLRSSLHALVSCYGTDVQGNDEETSLPSRASTSRQS